MSDKKIDLGNIPPKTSDELSEQELDSVSGGMFPSGRKSSPPSGKPPTYIPAPPAPQAPVPYPAGM